MEPVIVICGLIAAGWAVGRTVWAVRTLREQRRNSDSQAGTGYGGYSPGIGNFGGAGTSGDSGFSGHGHGGHGHGGGDCGGHGHGGGDCGGDGGW